MCIFILHSKTISQTSVQYVWFIFSIDIFNMQTDLKKKIHVICFVLGWIHWVPWKLLKSWMMDKWDRCYLIWNHRTMLLTKSFMTIRHRLLVYLTIQTFDLWQVFSELTLQLMDWGENRSLWGALVWWWGVRGVWTGFYLFVISGKRSLHLWASPSIQSCC